MMGISGTTIFKTTGDGGEEPIGVLVEEVGVNSAAAAAGIEAGDIIAAVDDLEIETMAQLVSEIRAHSAGDTINLTLVIDGSAQIVGVTL